MRFKGGRKVRVGMMPMFVLLFLLGTGVSSGAYAGAPSVNDYWDNTCEAAETGLVECIVTYIENIVATVANYFFTQFYPPLQDATYAAITLAVILFGVMAMFGMVEKLARETMILLIKIACIVYFTQNIQVLYGWLIGALDSLINVVSNYVTLKDLLLDNQGDKLRCNFNLNIWGRIDCLLEIIVGVNAPNSLSDGMLAFFFHNFYVGSMGVIIALLGLWMMFSFLSGMFVAIQTYLLALLTISLLVIFGAVMIPLLLFKGTYEHFETWARMIIGAILVPVVLFAFLNLVLTAFDIVLYSGEHSVFRTFAGDEVDKGGFRIQEYMYEKFDHDDNPATPMVSLIAIDDKKGVVHDQRQTDFKIPFELNVEGSYKQTAAYCDSDPATDPPDCTDKMTWADPENIAQIPIAIPLEKVDYPLASLKLKKNGYTEDVDGTALLKEMMASMIVTAMIAYVMIAMLKYVPIMAEDLAGGVRHAPSIAQVAASDLPGMGGNMAGRATSGFKQRMSGMVGKRS